MLRDHITTKLQSDHFVQKTLQYEQDLFPHDLRSLPLLIRRSPTDIHFQLGREARGHGPRLMQEWRSSRYDFKADPNRSWKIYHLPAEVMKTEDDRSYFKHDAAIFKWRICVFVNCCCVLKFSLTGPWCSMSYSEYDTIELYMSRPTTNKWTSVLLYRSEFECT